MQTIGIHIEYLLRTHDCVILPGVGAFLRTYVPAMYRDTDGALLPPHVKVCFNSSIVKSDGLLCHSLARRQRIDFEQAAVLVSEASERCRMSLQADGETAIGKLGILCMDAENRISFKPYPRQFEYAFKPLLPNKADVATADGVDVSLPGRAEDGKYYIIRLSRRAVRYAAMAAVMLLTATTLMLPSASRHARVAFSKQYASVVPGVERLSSGGAEIQSDVNLPEMEAESPVPNVMQEEPKRYYLIVATFSKVDDCQKFIKSQPDADVLDIAEGVKVNRVYSAASDSRDELQTLMNSDTHKSLHPQAWIWECPDTAS